MAKKTINLGTFSNDGTGDPIRNGGDIINDNFNEIYDIVGDGTNVYAGIVTNVKPGKLSTLSSVVSLTMLLLILLTELTLSVDSLIMLELEPQRKIMISL